MAKYGSDDVGAFLIDGYDVLGVTTTLDVDKEALLEETHALGDSWIEQSTTGPKRFEASQEGFFDDAAGSVNAALSEKQGTSRVVVIELEGNTKGKRFIGLQGAMQANYQRVATRGELHKANASYQGNGAVEEGRILHEHAAETSATGNTQTNSHDNAASSAAGGAGYLQVSALTLGGYTSLTVALQHSADNITFADITGGTFTAVTAAPAAERLAISGTINRYTAARWAFNGAGAGPSATFLAGLARS